MTMTEPRWRRYLRFWRRDTTADVDDELRFHFAQRIAEFEASGLSPSDALAAARERFGDVDDVRRDLVEIDRRVAHRVDTTAWLDAVRHDVRYAMRSLRRQPGLVATVVGTLALAVGANGAVFTVLDPVFFRAPAGVIDPGSVYRVYNDVPHWPGTVNGKQRRVWYMFGYPEYRAMRDALHGLATVAIDYSFDSADVAHGNATAAAGVSYATADLLPMLGVHLERGRTFTEAEDSVDTPANVAVISDRFARALFGRVDETLGKIIGVRGVRYQVIGVAGGDFEGTGLSATAVWVPFSTLPQLSTGIGPWYRRNDTFIPLLARLPPSSDQRGVEARATVAYRRAWDPSTGGGEDASILLGPLSFARGPLDRSREDQIATQIAAVAALLLLIACANTANLMLARGIARRREIAIRLALGVSRQRLAAQVLAEAMMFAIAAGAVSLLVAQWAGGVLRTELLPRVRWPAAPIAVEVLAFTLGASIIAGLLCGAAPAWIASRYGVSGALKAGARDGGENRGRLRGTLIALQAALSLVLMVGAALFARSLGNLRAIDFGYAADRLAIGSIYFADGQPHQEVSALMPELARRIGATPGVRGATAMYGGPMQGWTGFRLYRTGADSAHPLTGTFMSTAVQPDYFSVIGTRILAGRGFTGADRKDAAPVIVVSAAMARALWPGQSPLGQCLRPLSPAKPCYAVVGVAEDIHQSGRTRSNFGSEYYFPLDQLPVTRTPRAIIARAGTVDPDALATKMRAALHSTFPTADVQASSMTRMLEPELAPWIVGARLFGALAALALIVAMLGVYGSIAFEVRQRTREIGVRIALGATSTNVVALLVRRGTLTVGAGVAVGAVAAIAGAKLVATMLYGVKPTDPASLVASAAALLAAAAAASLVPALRARSVDPALVLRDE